ncbi:XRE family transcriptional regulator [Tissierellia bacterium S5-A11]|nr:XRE family transcriptional regulator [Tissierellia bacterium S5-A11]
MNNHELTFGDFISQKRKDLRITLKDMADRLNISSPYLSDVEKGKRDSFDLERLNQIAKILNLDEEESSLMMDLAGKQRNTVAPDLLEYILKTKGVSVALRKARDLDVKEEEWIKFIEEIEKER